MVAPEGTGDLSRSLVRVPGSGSDRQAMPSTCDLGRVSALAATVPINPRLPSIITNAVRQSAPPTPPTPPTSPPSEAEASAAKLGHKDSSVVKMAKQNVRTQPYVVPQRNSNQQGGSASPQRAVGSSTTQFPVLQTHPIQLPANFMANKHARIAYMTAEQVISLAPNIMHANTPAGPLLFMHVQKSNGTIKKTPTTINNTCGATNRPAGATNRASSTNQPIVVHPKPASSLVQETSNGLQPGSGVTVVTLEQLIRDQATLRQENEALQQQVAMFQQLFQDRARLEEVVRKLGIKINKN